MCNPNPNPTGCTGIRERAYIGMMWAGKVERASIQVGDGEA